MKPQYAKKIFSGEKKFEYRKKIPRGLQEVLVYATRPVKKVVGKFYVKSVVEDAPSVIWESTKWWSGIARKDYKNYFSARITGYAIEIEKTEEFLPPRELAYYGVRIPPQSYVYV